MGLRHLLLSFVVNQGFPMDVGESVGIPMALRPISAAQGFPLTLQNDLIPPSCAMSGHQGSISKETLCLPFAASCSAVVQACHQGIAPRYLQKLCKGWLVCKVVGVSWACQALFSLSFLSSFAFASCFLYFFLHQK